jgi:glycosyltransferase involved in cell wall biosynthesis
MKDFEQITCRGFDRVTWVIAEDRDAVFELHEHGPQKEILYADAGNIILPICVDPSDVQVVQPLTDAPVILFVGGMHWPPNAEGVLWFVQQVMPLVKKRVPKARLLAVGKSPPEQLRNFDNVEVPGFIEDLEPFWRKSRVFIAPLRAGGGMRVKILDAWAHGLPVVSTAIGAEGIASQDGDDILLADEPQMLARQLSRVLLDNNLAQSLAASGRAKVEECYDWRRIYPAWEQIYLETPNTAPNNK